MTPPTMDPGRTPGHWPTRPPAVIKPRQEDDHDGGGVGDRCDRVHRRSRGSMDCRQVTTTTCVYTVYTAVRAYIYAAVVLTGVEEEVG